MLSHAEAQALISARFDGPLDPVAERVLNAHIATCPSCRAFSQSAGQLARGLRQLPYLPASPAVSRAVLEHVNAPRPPWSRFGVPSLSTMMPALAAAAVALLLVVAGAFAFLRVQDGDDPEPASLNAPSSQSTSEVAQSDPTATATVPPTVGITITDDDPTESSAANLSNPTATGGTEPGVASTAVPSAEETETPPPSSVTATEVPATDESSGDTTVERSGGEQPSSTAATGNDASLSGSEGTPPPTQAPATDTPTAIPSQTPEPTETVTPESTATAAPTATEVPTGTVVPTLTPEPTGTPEPTATATSEPTATATPDPTNTPEPSVTTTPDPTVTPEPSATDVPTPDPTATEVPTLTPEPSATATPTRESAAAGIPTEAVTETPEPTNTPEPTPTTTPEPTATVTPEPTDPPVATSPPIEARDGTAIAVDDADETPVDNAPEEAAPSGDETVTPVDDATEDAVPSGNAGENIIASIVPTQDDETATSDAEQDNSESGDGDESPPIGPSDGTTPIPADDDDGTEEPSTEEASAESGDGDDDDTGNGDDDGDDNSGSGGGDDDDGNGGGEDDAGQGGDDDGTATAEATTVDAGAGEGEEAGNDDSPTLADAAVFPGAPPATGDPDSRLGLGADGTLVVSPFPGRLSLAREGLTLSAAPGPSGQAVLACNDAGACLDATSASATGPHQDTPLGWLSADELLYQRIDETAAAPVQYRVVRFDPVSRVLLDDVVLGDGGYGLASLLRPYPVAGGVLVLTESDWLRIDSGGLTVLDENPYGAGVDLLRVQPALGELSYVADGQLITASVTAPGTPLNQIPFAGRDYDRAPDGRQVVISDGTELRIVAADGTAVRTIANPAGIAIGAVAWVEEGIVFVDASTGESRVIDPGT